MEVTMGIREPGSIGFTPWTAEILDRMALIEIRSPSYLQLPTAQLYEAARNLIGEPLTYAASKQLWDRVEQDDVVIICAGFVVPPWMTNSEVDGVPSSLALARALQISKGARVMILTEPTVVDVFKAGAISIGMRPVSEENLALYPTIGRSARGVCIMDFPIDTDEAKVRAEELINKFHPKAAIAVEKVGPAADGKCYTGRGGDLTAESSKAHVLFDIAPAHNILTIGCFDLGNEIGSGSIIEAVKPLLRHGTHIACETRVDIPFPASNSAWAAYLIAAGLAGFAENLEVAHTEELERRLLDACISKGMLDAPTLAPTRTISGAHIDDYGHWIELCRSIVKYCWKHFDPKLRK
jgi:hypothetical protein